MANIYTIASPGTAFVNDKCLLGLYNGTGSGKVVRIYKIIMTNAQTVAVTGLNNRIGLWRITTGSGGLPVQPIKHDSSSPAIPSQIAAATNMSYTLEPNAKFTRFTWSSDEPAAFETNGIDEVQTLPYFTTIYDYAQCYLNESNVQPIILREGYGFGVIFEGAFSAGAVATPVGVCDVFIEFTVENS